MRHNPERAALATKGEVSIDSAIRYQFGFEQAGQQHRHMPPLQLVSRISEYLQENFTAIQNISFVVNPKDTHDRSSVISYMFGYIQIERIAISIEKIFLFQKFLCCFHDYPLRLI
jgi:hypothetical protein